LDYVLKPISYFAFSQRLNRAIGRIKKRISKTISINIKGGTVRLDVANITYVESQGHTLIFHTTGAEYEASGTMKELEKDLESLNFYRANKGYLINLAHVDGIKDACAVVRGEALLISRSRKKDFMEMLTRYWGEVM